MRTVVSMAENEERSGGFGKGEINMVPSHHVGQEDDQETEEAGRIQPSREPMAISCMGFHSRSGGRSTTT